MFGLFDTVDQVLAAAGAVDLSSGHQVLRPVVKDAAQVIGVAVILSALRSRPRGSGLGLWLVPGAGRRARQRAAAPPRSASEPEPAVVLSYD